MGGNGRDRQRLVTASRGDEGSFGGVAKMSRGGLGSIGEGRAETTRTCATGRTAAMESIAEAILT